MMVDRMHSCNHLVAHVDSLPRGIVEKAMTVHFCTSLGVAVAAVELVASEEVVKVSNPHAEVYFLMYLQHAVFSSDQQ